MAYAALGLLSYGASKERNLVWERLQDQQGNNLTCLHAQTTKIFQAFNVAKSVARFSFGLSKDDTGRLSMFVERIEANSSAGYCNDFPEGNCGVFNLYGPMSFILLTALQLHAMSI